MSNTPTCQLYAAHRMIVLRHLRHKYLRCQKQVDRGDVWLEWVDNQWWTILLVIMCIFYNPSLIVSGTGGVGNC